MSDYRTQHDEYTLHHGDCLELMATLPDASIDAIITDPPYGTTACKWDSVIPFAPMWEQLKRLTKPRGAIVLFGSQPFTSALVMSNPKWFRYEWVWDKVLATGHLSVSRRPMNQHDNILVFSQRQHLFNAQRLARPGARIRNARAKVRRHDDVYGDYNRPAERQEYYSPKTLLQYSNADRSLIVHPTQKPLALLEYLVKTYTHEGDLVLDFTMGSGTTGAACLATGRNFIGIEQDDGYYQIAADRLARARAQLHQQELAL